MYPTIKKGVPCLLLSALSGFVLTFLAVIILAGLLLQQEIPMQFLKIILTIITIVSGIISGLIIGKKMKEKKFLWGCGVGILYFLLLFLVKCLFGVTADTTPENVLPLFLCCVGGGVLGGMLG